MLLTWPLILLCRGTNKGISDPTWHLILLGKGTHNRIHCMWLTEPLVLAYRDQVYLLARCTLQSENTDKVVHGQHNTQL
jgi:hypothetical protein